MSAGPQRPLAGAAATTAVHLGSRLCRSNAQVVSKSNGASACLPKVRCPMLELHALKGARAVLRGRGGSDASPLPDRRRALRMQVELLDVMHYPRPGWMPWHTIETPNPDWPTIEAAIRQLDRLEWPFVTLHAVAPVDGKVPINALTVMGGRGEYTLFWSEDT